MIKNLEIGYYMPSKENQAGYADRIEIMAIAKGYVMWRRKGCLPNAHSEAVMLTFLNDKQATKVKK